MPGVKHTIKADSVAICPEQIDVLWQERVVNVTWTENENIKLECISGKTCCPSVHFDGETFFAKQGYGLRSAYSNGDAKILFTGGEWRKYRHNVFEEAFASKAFCLEDVLNDDNISNECLSAQIVPKHKKANAVVKDKPDAFEWTVADWQETVESTPTGSFVKSPIFETAEGYQFEMRVYPNGRYSSSSNQISAYAYQGDQRPLTPFCH